MQRKNVERRKFNKIIRLIRKDAQKGLECFYYEYGKFIYTTAKYNGCSGEKASIVVNTVLVKIWKKANQISDIENPTAWLSTVVKNCVRDELNKPWCLELKEGICEANDNLQKVIDKNGFEYLLTPLKDSERELFTLRFVIGYTFKDIAIYFNKPLATITTTYYRALKKIKNFLKQEKYE